MRRALSVRRVLLYRSHTNEPGNKSNTGNISVTWLMPLSVSVFRLGMTRTVITATTLALLLFVGLSSSLCAPPYEKYTCDRGYFLDRSISSDGTQSVHWSHNINLSAGTKSRAGGGYMKGHKIRLGDLALWLDPSCCTDKLG